MTHASQVMRCYACDRPGRPSGHLICETCSDTMLDDLNEVVERFDMLDANPGKTGDQSRGAPGFHSQAPGSVHVMTMLDSRSKDYPVREDAECEEKAPPLAVYGTLRGLCEIVIEEREMSMRVPADVASAVSMIRSHADWISRCDDGPAFVFAARRLRDQLRRVTGYQGPRKIGQCIDYLDDDRQCNAPIYMPAETEPRAPDEPASGIPPVQCGKCGSVCAVEMLRLRSA